MPDEAGLRARAIAIAHDALQGRIGILEAARSLAPLLHSLPGLATKEDFNTIIGIDSETDDLPIGHVRMEWHPDSLSEKDKEIARLELLWRERVLSVCGRMLGHATDRVRT